MACFIVPAAEVVINMVAAKVMISKGKQESAKLFSDGSVE